MLYFLGFDLKEDIQILSTQLVITLNPFNFVQFFFFFFIPGFPSSPHSFIFKAFVQHEMTRAELFFKKRFEVCLLNKVFAAIIRLHIQIQTHFMLEVTENCYHLMALWAEFSQTTLHALHPSFWALPRETSGSEQHSDCRSFIVASWILNLTVMMLWPGSVGVIPIWFGLFTILISLEFSLLTLSPPIYL